MKRDLADIIFVGILWCMGLAMAALLIWGVREAMREAMRELRIEVVCHSGAAEIYRTMDADRAIDRGGGSWFIQEHGGGSVLVSGACVTRAFERTKVRP